MTPHEQARRYVDAIPGAVSGDSGHNQTFAVAMTLLEGFGLSVADARHILADYNMRCSPAWSERELEHKLADAERKVDPAKRGKLVKKNVRWTPTKPAAYSPAPVAATPRPHTPAKPKEAGVRYAVADTTEIPEAIADGTRKFLLAAFREGEGVRIAVARTNDDAKEVPKDQGVTLSREEWLRKLDTHKGNPNGFLKTADKNGIFVSVNPMKPGGSLDADVTDFRHALLEFDNISVTEQWGIICASQIPCTAVISSGGKSIHAWVRVDAADRREFDERVASLYAHFAEYQPDTKNKNPSRFSRLPNCERGGRRQELLALECGCKSFTEWLALKQSTTGETINPEQLWNFDSSQDPSTLLGNRWICRGMACLLVGPSGVGKSSLNMQMSVAWSVGMPQFGIAPVKPLKSLVIQAENDNGDLSEMFKGVCLGLNIEQKSEASSLIQSNLVFHSDTSKTGDEFLQSLQRLLDIHKPDLLWLDPILSFVGADISRQEVIATFFRHGLNPILKASNCACFIVHHTGKPPTDKGARQGWQTSDYAYMGLGSSDLTNWARAVIVLQDRGQGLFELKLAKRGKRAGVIGTDGVHLTTSLWLRHATEPGRIFWEQGEEPEQPSRDSKKGGKPSKVDALLAIGLGPVIDGLTEPVSKAELARAIESFAATKSLDTCQRTCERAVEVLVSNKAVKKTDSGYVKN